MNYIEQDFNIPAPLTAGLRYTPIVILTSILFLFFLVLPAWSQHIDPSAGKNLFIQHCSRCHGIQGGGGEGPALNRYNLPRAADDVRMADVISNGIAGTGMPGNWALSTKEVTEIVHFVRGLGRIDSKVVPGNAVQGKILFEKSGCYTCHVIGEKGTSIGPDLATVGLRRGSTFLRGVIENPGKYKSKDENGFILYLVIDVTLENGAAITGIRLNEDTFTLQLKDGQNQIHSIRKNEVRSVQRRKEASLMPSFSETLSEEERTDIVAFLMNQK